MLHGFDLHGGVYAVCRETWERCVPSCERLDDLRRETVPGIGWHLGDFPQGVEDKDNQEDRT